MGSGEKEVGTGGEFAFLLPVLQVQNTSLKED